MYSKISVYRENICSNICSWIKIMSKFTSPKWLWISDMVQSKIHDWCCISSFMTALASTCNFDNGLCYDWQQSLADVFNWTINTGSTWSSNTGPDYDHTSGLGMTKIHLLPLILISFTFSVSESIWRHYQGTYISQYISTCFESKKWIKDVRAKNF